MIWMITQSCYFDPSSRAVWAGVPFLFSGWNATWWDLPRSSLLLSDKMKWLFWLGCVRGLAFQRESCNWYRAHQPIQSSVIQYVSWYITRKNKDSVRHGWFKMSPPQYTFGHQSVLMFVFCYQIFILLITDVGIGLKYWVGLYWGHRKCLKACFCASCTVLIISHFRSAPYAYFAS